MRLVSNGFAITCIIIAHMLEAERVADFMNEGKVSPRCGVAIEAGFLQTGIVGIEPDGAFHRVVFVDGVIGPSIAIAHLGRILEGNVGWLIGSDANKVNVGYIRPQRQASRGNGGLRGVEFLQAIYLIIAERLFIIIPSRRRRAPCDGAARCHVPFRAAVELIDDLIERPILLCHCFTTLTRC